MRLLTFTQLLALPSYGEHIKFILIDGKRLRRGFETPWILSLAPLQNEVLMLTLVSGHKEKTLL